MLQIYSNKTTERIIFSYNKAHNADQTIPQWIVKTRGETFYVNHLESTVGFSTKETPTNPHTKGSIQFKGKLLITDNEGVITAHVT